MLLWPLLCWAGWWLGLAQVTPGCCETERALWGISTLALALLMGPAAPLSSQLSETEARNDAVAEESSKVCVWVQEETQLPRPSELGAPAGTGAGAEPGSRGRNAQGLARPCGAGMRQGGPGQVIKELKCCLPPEPSCPFPAAWG